MGWFTLFLRLFAAVLFVPRRMPFHCHCNDEGRRSTWCSSSSLSLYSSSWNCFFSQAIFIEYDEDNEDYYDDEYEYYSHNPDDKDGKEKEEAQQRKSRPPPYYNSSITNVEHAQRQIEWIRSMEGFVSSKVQIRAIQRRWRDDDDSHHKDQDANANAPLGVFAMKDFQKGELIFSIPRDCLLTAADDEEDDNTTNRKKDKKKGNDNEPTWDVCRTARNLAREMRLGNQSFYAPYMEYLLSQPHGQLPSTWSEAGQDVLLRLTGARGANVMDDDDDDENNDRIRVDENPPLIPPFGAISWLDDEWRSECQGGNDLLDQQAFLLVIQRGWDDLMIPLYDLLSHRNGPWHNTATAQSVHDTTTDAIRVVASRHIRAGEELYGSYTECSDCGGRVNTYGTPEILRDYGTLLIIIIFWGAYIRVLCRPMYTAAF